jgi:hypothetical protein
MREDAGATAPAEVVMDVDARFRGYAGLAAVLLWLVVPTVVLADEEANVAALEAKCEAAREARIKPLRDAEIAKCKADGRNDPGYCERYWSDYGSAHRMANGVMSPRMFDDLPECKSAAQARKALNQAGH